MLTPERPLQLIAPLGEYESVRTSEWAWLTSRLASDDSSCRAAADSALLLSWPIALKW